MAKGQKTPGPARLAQMLANNSKHSDFMLSGNSVTAGLDDGKVIVSSYNGLAIFVDKSQPRYAQLIQSVEDTLDVEKLAYEKDDWDLPNGKQKWTRFRIKD